MGEYRLSVLMKTPRHTLFKNMPDADYITYMTCMDIINPLPEIPDGTN